MFDNRNVNFFFLWECKSASNQLIIYLAFASTIRNLRALRRPDVATNGIPTTSHQMTGGVDTTRTNAETVDVRRRRRISVGR